MSHQWIIREPHQQDLSFIYSTWLKSYHYDSWTKHTRKSVFFDNYKLVLDHLLDTSKILVACLIKEPHVILGYFVYDDDIIHYTFVKETFRNMGIAQSMYKRAFPHDIDIDVTHQTKMSYPILKQRDNLTFNPFLLFKGVPNEQTEERTNRIRPS